MLIARDFLCAHCGTLFDDLVERGDVYAPCPGCPYSADVVMSAPAVVMVAAARPHVSSRPLPPPPAKPSEEKRRDLHQQATANLARDLVTHGNGHVSEKRAATIARDVAVRQLNRAGG